MQTFDRSAMVRALAANGFEVSFIKARNSELHGARQGSHRAGAMDAACRPSKLAERREAYRSGAGPRDSQAAR